MTKPKLGSGKRFEAIEKKAEASGARNPAAVAAAAGMKKYGKERMAEMAAEGRRKKSDTHMAADHFAEHEAMMRKGGKRV